MKKYHKVYKSSEVENTLIDWFNDAKYHCDRENTVSKKLLNFIQDILEDKVPKIRCSAVYKSEYIDVLQERESNFHNLREVYDFIKKHQTQSFKIDFLDLKLTCESSENISEMSFSEFEGFVRCDRKSWESTIIINTQK